MKKIRVYGIALCVGLLAACSTGNTKSAADTDAGAPDRNTQSSVTTGSTHSTGTSASNNLNNGTAPASTAVDTGNAGSTSNAPMDNTNSGRPGNSSNSISSGISNVTGNPDSSYSKHSR